MAVKFRSVTHLTVTFNIAMQRLDGRALSRSTFLMNLNLSLVVDLARRNQGGVVAVISALSQ
jgi:hypothetical protein